MEQTKLKQLDKYTVVVADDEIALRQAIVNMVDWEAIGFVVVGEAENGIEALELVEKFAPDLLLSDIRMPFVSGIELARQARELRPAMNIAFLSGYDDFAYAQEAIAYNVISYLLKPISADKLTKALIEIKQKIDLRYSEFAGIALNAIHPYDAEHEHQLQYIMALTLDRAGSIGDGARELYAAEAEEVATKFGFKKNASDLVSYAVMVIELFDDQAICSNQSHVHAINTILRKYVKPATFYVQGKIIAVLAESPNTLRRFLNILANEIVQMAQRVLGYKVIIGVSGSFERLAGCRNAYYEAHRAAQYGYHNQATLSFIDDIEMSPDAVVGGARDITEPLTNMLKIDDFNTIEHYLAPFFCDKRYCGNSGNIALRHSQVIAAVTGAINVVMGQDGVKQLFCYSDMKQVFAELDNFSDEEIGQLVFNRLLGLCAYAKDLITAFQRKQSDRLSDLAIVAINEQFQDPDLSLATLADKLHVSPSYLSTVIKKAHGQTFTELLSETRMKMAKDLLLSTSVRIAEVSERSGFRDQHYFSYCFKKWYDVSPNKFRLLKKGTGK